MHELTKAIAQIREKDPRYAVEAYFFVFEALHFAHNELKMSPAHSDDEPLETSEIEQEESEDSSDESYSPNHLTGQQLCEAIRQYALEQYGYMANCVLKNWGVKKTLDFGNIVFNLIDVGQMRKTPHDKHEDFEDVFDFEKDLQESFKIIIPD